MMDGDNEDDSCTDDKTTEQETPAPTDDSASAEGAIMLTPKKRPAILEGISASITPRGRKDIVHSKEMLTKIIEDKLNLEGRSDRSGVNLKNYKTCDLTVKLSNLAQDERDKVAFSYKHGKRILVLYKEALRKRKKIEMFYIAEEKKDEVLKKVADDLTWAKEGGDENGPFTDKFDHGFAWDFGSYCGKKYANITASYATEWFAPYKDHATKAIYKARMKQEAAAAKKQRQQQQVPEGGNGAEEGLSTQKMGNLVSAGAVPRTRSIRFRRKNQATAGTLLEEFNTIDVVVSALPDGTDGKHLLQFASKQDDQAQTGVFGFTEAENEALDAKALFLDFVAINEETAFHEEAFKSMTLTVLLFSDFLNKIL